MITTLSQQLIALLIVSVCFFGTNSTLIYNGAGCKTQAKNLGSVSAATCARIVTHDAACTEGTFMYSHRYPSWGCRCCSVTEGGIPNANWDVYSIYSANHAIPNHGCKSQATNFGTLTANQCATKVANDPLCSKGSFMFSNTYPSWGCRCCSATEGGDENVNWNVYSIYSATLAIASHGCKSQTKNFGYIETAGQCAALVGSDPLCTKGSFMFSNTYSSWGCRCCLVTRGGDENVNWNIYSIYSANLAIPNQGCKSQTKNFGKVESANLCAALAGSDPLCTKGSFMFSKSYPSWGCRCCLVTQGGDSNDNWNVYSITGVNIVSGSAAIMDKSELEYFEGDEEYFDDEEE